MNLYETLIDRLCYCPETGLFTYNYDYNIMKKGDIAGTANTNGHIQISINRKLYMAHNLAWLYMTKQYPKNFIIDHKDRIYDNNKWNNLRKATNSQNMGNCKIRIDNSSGHKGVHFCKRNKKFVAQITIKGKRKFLGYFDNALEAHLKYKDVAIKYFGKFHHV